MAGSPDMEINRGRWTAEVDGDFVVFLIGATVHDPAAAGAAGPLLAAMADMLGELAQYPEHGLLGFQTHGDAGVIVQYWRSFEALETYARNPSAKHQPVWREWNRLAEDDLAAAGVWHETFLVPAGSYEAMYQNMSSMGLQKAGSPVTIAEARTSARQRIGA